MDQEIQRRMGAAVRKFGQPHARLFPCIGMWVQTPLGEGQLLAVFASACEVWPGGKGPDGEPKHTFRARPEDITPVNDLQSGKV
jgi:hypothetical protein